MLADVRISVCDGIHIAHIGHIQGAKDGARIACAYRQLFGHFIRLLHSKIIVIISRVSAHGFEIQKNASKGSRLPSSPLI